MNGLQCDTCRTFAPGSAPPAGWLMLLQQEPPSMSPMIAILGGGGNGGAELAGTFCSVRCLAEYAYVRMAAESTQGGMPGGEGWHG